MDMSESCETLYMQQVVNVTLIASSIQSILDMCDNELVAGKNMHCTFKLPLNDIDWVEAYFRSKGGLSFSVTNVFD